MTFAKVLIIIIMVSVFLFTTTKLVKQIKEYKNKKCSKKNEVENQDVNNIKEVK